MNLIEFYEYLGSLINEGHGYKEIRIPISDFNNEDCMIDDIENDLRFYNSVQKNNTVIKQKTITLFSS